MIARAFLTTLRAFLLLAAAVGYELFDRYWLVQEYGEHFRVGEIGIDDIRPCFAKTPFVLEPRKRLSRGGYEVFLQTEGMFIVATRLTWRDGVQTNHMIYIDAERDVVCFGLNEDAVQDTIVFKIEKADRMDTAAAEANLINTKNFPVGDNPGHALRHMEVLEVAEIMVKTKHLKRPELCHVAYKVDTKRGTEQHEDQCSVKRAKTAREQRAEKRSAAGGEAPTKRACVLSGY